MASQAHHRPIISLENVRLTLPGRSQEVNILRDITLQITHGETVSVIGPSGSGKTSLLMVIAGLEKATAGKVEVAGHDMTQGGEDSLARFRQKHIGIVFQSFHLIPTMTALENVLVPLELARRDNAEKRATELLARVGLQDRLDHFPSQLSGGEQQRVAMARAYAAEPDLLLADEPTGNLDADTGRLVIQQMSDLQQYHNATLVLVTHNQLLANACERKIVLEDGKIVSDGKPQGKANAA